MPSTVLITGCSSGIGRATAQLFQARGWNVVATMRSPQQETELRLLERVLVARLDVQDEASIQAAVDAALARFGRIDVLVNNAGYGAYGPLEATPMDKVRRQFDVNVHGLIATTQAVLPHLRRQRSGVVVNISSIGGRLTFPLGTLYHGTKFAVEGLSEALHYELLPLGVQVKLVEPGMVQTDFAGRSFDFSNDPSLAEYQPVVQALLGALGPMAATASEPAAVAEVIFEAATDGRDRLRYEAGADAQHLLATRRAADDATFLGAIRSQFGIAPAAPAVGAAAG
jgi:NAD(P)-dependent dehydrogenase (short-subunit alcohol dehydrogenase family)